MPDQGLQERDCACGCKASLQGRRKNAVYATDACKTRAWRARTGYTLQAARKPSQTPKKPSGLQLSYRKAVTYVAAHLANHRDPTPERTAQAILEPALPAAQRHRLQKQRGDTPTRASHT